MAEALLVHEQVRAVHLLKPEPSSGSKGVRAELCEIVAITRMMVVTGCVAAAWSWSDCLVLPAVPSFVT